MKRLRKIGMILLVLVVLFAGGTWMIAGQLSKKINKEIQIGEMNLDGMEDGVYMASYVYNEAMGATVVVTVVDHQIGEIAIEEHKSGLGSKAEQIVDRVIDQQSLQVDAISGATGSSKIILKAIETALQ
ncbi:hypothetical protein SANA_11920 [Gottschalkiaceae bacterium SANA]|nr:hypothetical protein SANA_11920 [Gottschalkiaceae bacterium SANA]